jgi:replicative superfamily II helicase
LFTAGIVKGRESNPKLMLDAMKSRNNELKELIQSGVGVHHAGMLRSDRNLVEKMFEEGMLKLLVCTATLAWGVNLPAHTVLIKGPTHPCLFCERVCLLPVVLYSRV